MAQWFVRTAKGQAGPVSLEKLRGFVANGKVKPSSAVSPDGQSWVKAETIEDLFPPAVDPPELGGAFLGFTEESKLPFVEQREAAYAKVFGPCSQVSHELLPVVPHIDVYIHPPHGDRDFTTLVTGGMSDEPMPIPPGPCSPRAELLLYVSEPTDEYVNLLRFLAQLPYKQDTWFSYGSTVSNGNPPQPIFEDSVLDCYVFIPSVIPSDHDICDSVLIDGDPLQLLWVQPITSAERQLIIDEDIDAFYDLLNKRKHPLTIDPNRKCYVKRKGWFGF